MNSIFSIFKRIYEAIIRKIMWIKLQTSGYKSMKCLDTIFQEEKIAYWITAGTLLGAYREKRFIKSDLDIDLVIHSNELHKLIEIARAYNIKIQSITKINNAVCELSFHYKGIKYDFFIAYKIGEKEYVSICWDKLNSRRTKMNVARVFFPEIKKTQRIQLNKIQVSAPENIDEYLTLHYGENYMTPDSNWRFFKDLKPPAIYYDVNELYGYCDDKF